MANKYGNPRTLHDAINVFASPTKGARRMPLHTSPRLAELSGVAGALDKDGYLLQAQP